MRLTTMFAATAILMPIAPAALAADSVAIDPAATAGGKPCGGNRSTGYAPAKPARPSSKLGDMPPATHIKAVYRMLGGCPVPIVVARGVGTPQPGATPDDPTLPARIMPAGR